MFLSISITSFGRGPCNSLPLVFVASMFFVASLVPMFFRVFLRLNVAGVVCACAGAGVPHVAISHDRSAHLNQQPAATARGT